MSSLCQHFYELDILIKRARCQSFDVMLRRALLSVPPFARVRLGRQIESPCSGQKSKRGTEQGRMFAGTQKLTQSTNEDYY